MTTSTTSSPPITPTRVNASVLRTAPAREAATFLGLVYLLVLGIAIALPHARISQLLSMFAPLLSIVVITFVRTPRGRRTVLWRGLGLRHLGLRSWPVTVGISLVVVLLVPYGVSDLLGSSRVAPLDSVAKALLLTLPDLVIASMFAMLEEIGWRGYLLPRAQALMSRRRAAVAVGFVHGLFHMPLVLIGTTYDSVGNRWIVAPIVVATLTAAGVFYAWLKDRSGSTWTAGLAHGAVNTMIEGGGVVVIVSPVALAYTAGESGLATLLAVIGCAVILLIRGRTWSQPTARSVPAGRLHEPTCQDIRARR